MFFYDFDSRILPLLQSLASLYSECCRPDDEVRLVFFERQVSRSEWGRYGNSFDLSLFYNDDFPANPSSLGRNEGNEHRESETVRAGDELFWNWLMCVCSYSVDKSNEFDPKGGND